MKEYCDKNLSSLLEIILQGNNQSDEAMYYLLTDRLYGKLTAKYVSMGNVMDEVMTDVLADFFLYLREESGNSTLPYSVLHTIKKKEAFESWIISTFRNFLNNKIVQQKNESIFGERITSTVDDNALDKEELIKNAAILIAYSHQVLVPRNQFLLLRTLLTLLNKENALPHKEMAETMGMSYVHYRVTTYRIMQSVRKHQMDMEAGKKLLLDDYHKSMAENIYNDFNTLYSTLIKYYNMTLDNLENASKIHHLRKSYYESTGLMLHEEIASYGSLSIYGFYHKLNSCINQRLAA